MGARQAGLLSCCAAALLCTGPGAQLWQQWRAGRQPRLLHPTGSSGSRRSRVWASCTTSAEASHVSRMKRRSSVLLLVTPRTCTHIQFRISRLAESAGAGRGGSGDSSEGAGGGKE